MAGKPEQEQSPFRDPDLLAWASWIIEELVWSGTNKIISLLRVDPDKGLGN